MVRCCASNRHNSLARIVGYSDAVAESLLDRGEREVVIKAAIAQR